MNVRVGRLATALDVDVLAILVGWMYLGLSAGEQESRDVSRDFGLLLVLIGGGFLRGCEIGRFDLAADISSMLPRIGIRKQLSEEFESQSSSSIALEWMCVFARAVTAMLGFSGRRGASQPSARAERESTDVTAGGKSGAF